MDRIRILLADDNADIRESVCRLLADEFEIVAAVADGQRALEQVENLHPDVLILDISMPGMNGIELAKVLAGSGTRIVFLTVHDDIGFIRESLATGALGYVIKPHMAVDLPRAVRDAHAGRTFVSASPEI